MRTRISLFALLLGALISAGCAGETSVPADGETQDTAGESEGGNSAKPPGRWRRARSAAGDAELDDEQRRLKERLQSLGYLAGSTPAPEGSGVIHHVPQRVFGGLNFYTSGHAPEAILMDMQGQVLHRWRSRFEDVWPDAEPGADNPNPLFWRRALLFPGGEIIAVHDGLGILKLDARSNVLWARDLPAHHDLGLLPNGDLWVLTREVTVRPDVLDGSPVLEDFVSLIDAEGREKRRISLIDALERTEGMDWQARSAAFWEKEKTRKLAHPRADLLHANGLDILGENLPEGVDAFRPGHLLVSLCHLDMIALLDPDAERFTWMLEAELGLQHDPTLTPEGDILLFNNAWQKGRSRVQRNDPVTRETRWSYRGGPRTPFYSRTCGTAQALPGGNVLITESDRGRAIEVTSDGRIAWEFLNPHRAGENDEFIATLFEVLRLPPDFPVGWADGAE